MNMYGKKRRLKYVPIDERHLDALITGRIKIGLMLPDDAEHITTYWDAQSRSLNMVYEAECFEPVPEGVQVPPYNCAEIIEMPDESPQRTRPSRRPPSPPQR
jgi:hypothetical protein